MEALCSPPPQAAGRKYPARRRPSRRARHRPRDRLRHHCGTGRRAGVGRRRRTRRPGEEGHRHADRLQCGELLAELEGAVQVHRGHRRRPRLHGRHHRLLFRHPRHARTRRVLHADQAGQRPRQVPPRPAEGRRQRFARRPRPQLHQGLGEGGLRLRFQEGPGPRARPGLLQPGSEPGQVRRRRRARPVHLLRRHRHARRRRRLHQLPQHPQARPHQGQAPGPGRQRDHLAQRLPRRPGLGDEAGGGAQRHQPGRHGPAGMAQEGQPQPQHPLDWKVYGDPFHIG